MRMGINLGVIDPNEIKIAVNNLGKRVSIFGMNSEGIPSILYFGDVPRSMLPLILASLHLYEDKKGNKCVVFCSLIIDSDGSYFPIELRIPSDKLKLLLSEYLIFDFCDRIDNIENGSIVCNNRRVLGVINSISKDFINKLMEEMKNAGNEEEAWNEYLRESKYPPCMKFIEKERGNTSS